LTVLSVVFGPAARTELIEARDWYSPRGEELAARFIAEVETVVERVATAPLHFPVVYRDVRRARCRRFSYALFFRIMDGTVHIIACFHSSRDSRRWQQRS
jgi:plasmid stabilization system protein ParE